MGISSFRKGPPTIASDLVGFSLSRIRYVRSSCASTVQSLALGIELADASEAQKVGGRCSPRFRS